MDFSEACHRHDQDGIAKEELVLVKAIIDQRIERIIDAKASGDGHPGYRCFVKFGIEIRHQTVTEPDIFPGNRFGLFAIAPGLIGIGKSFFVVAHERLESPHLNPADEEFFVVVPM